MDGLLPLVLNCEMLGHGHHTGGRIGNPIQETRSDAPHLGASKRVTPSSKSLLPVSPTAEGGRTGFAFVPTPTGLDRVMHPNQNTNDPDLGETQRDPKLDGRSPAPGTELRNAWSRTEFGDPHGWEDRESNPTDSVRCAPYGCIESGYSEFEESPARVTNRRRSQNQFRIFAHPDGARSSYGSKPKHQRSRPGRNPTGPQTRWTVSCPLY